MLRVSALWWGVRLEHGLRSNGSAARMASAFRCGGPFLFSLSEAEMGLPEWLFAFRQAFSVHPI